MVSLKVSGLGVPDLPLGQLYHIEFDVVKSLPTHRGYIHGGVGVENRNHVAFMHCSNAENFVSRIAPSMGAVGITTGRGL